jgi:hypothetical protein
MNAADASAQAKELGRRAENSDGLDHAVRVGLVSYGIVHLLIAWVAVQLSLGDRSGSASSGGALSQMASTPLGGVLMYVVAAGLAALVVWRVTEAIGGHRQKDGKERLVKRLGSGLKAVLYGALGWSALKIAWGGGSDGGSTDTTTAKIMSLPGGQVLVFLVGLGVLGYACRLVYRGLSESFVEHLSGKGSSGADGRAYVLLGKVGYVGKGIALLPVAGLFIWAAWAHDPQKSGGLDQALTKVLQQPFGSPVVFAMGVGLACYGLFAFAWARHLDR